MTKLSWYPRNDANQGDSAIEDLITIPSLCLKDVLLRCYSIHLSGTNRVVVLCSPKMPVGTAAIKLDSLNSIGMMNYCSARTKFWHLVARNQVVWSTKNFGLVNNVSLKQKYVESL